MPIETLPVPRVAESDRVTVDALGLADRNRPCHDRLCRLHRIARGGGRAAAARLGGHRRPEINPDEASYFLSKVELARGDAPTVLGSREAAVHCDLAVRHRMPACYFGLPKDPRP